MRVATKLFVFSGKESGPRAHFVNRFSSHKNKNSFVTLSKRFFLPRRESVLFFPKYSNNCAQKENQFIFSHGQRKIDWLFNLLSGGAALICRVAN
jgi:hypothetical protein